MTKAVWGARIRLTGAFMLALASASCGEMSRQGSASSYLIVTALEAASGADDTTFTATLSSDVITVVDQVPTTFSDPGQVSFRLALKDPEASPTGPTENNFITIDRYHVQFTRTDGRNTEGVDVPYAFDGAITGTIADQATLAFTLVRVQAKAEAPLRALSANGGVISTIAEVTFYGRDQTGREVSVSGRISVHFANWGDPG